MNQIKSLWLLALVGVVALMTFGCENDPPTAPLAPTNLTIAASSTSLSVSWDEVSTATSYNLYWSTTAGVTKNSGTKIEGATRPYVHSERVNATTYYYIVTAVNSTGESNASDEASGTPEFEGMIDTSFGTNGYVTQTITGSAAMPSDVEDSGLAIDSDGNIYVGGVSCEDEDTPIASQLFKFDSTGVLVAAFGTNGIVDYGNDTTITDIQIDSNGDILVSGKESIDDNSYLRIKKYSSLDGSLVSGYGTAGVVSLDYISSPGRGIIDSNDNLFLGGAGDVTGEDYSMMLWKFNGSGAPDTTFGGTGYASYREGDDSVDGAYGVAIDSSGNIVVAGHLRDEAEEYSIRIWRFTDAGALDSAGFGTNGVVSGTVESEAFSITMDSAGYIYVAGTSGVDWTFPTVWKYDSAGAPVTTFSDDGVYSYSPSGTIGGFRGISIENGGNLLTPGEYSIGDKGDAYLLNIGLSPSDGALVTDYFTDGVYTDSSTFTSAAFNTSKIDSLGRQVVMGYAKIDESTYGVIVARFK